MCTTCGCGVGEARVDGKGLPEAESPVDGQSTSSVRPSQLAEHSHSGLRYNVLNPAGRGAPLPTGSAQHVHPHQHGADGSGHRHPPASEHLHEHGHAHDEAAAHSHHHAAAHAADGNAAAGTSQSRLLQIERDILAANDGFAAGR
jgi:hydrogenase nickel incorporation protein HypB